MQEEIEAGISNTMNNGKLSIVATPIGNLEDITLRALRTLQEAAAVYCEDTRVTAKLFARYDIKTPLKRLDANIEITKAQEVIERLFKGEHIAYVTDAGTPGVSDPGSRLVAYIRAHRNETIDIEAIPGASALTAALSIAGIQALEFIFMGFLPHKKGRQTLLKKIADTKSVVVLYESSHRINKLLAELDTVIQNRKIVVLRELTKKFENVQLGTPQMIKAFFDSHESQVRGEFVVIVESTD